MAVARRFETVKAVTDALGLARSNVIGRLAEARSPRGLQQREVIGRVATTAGISGETRRRIGSGHVAES